MQVHADMRLHAEKVVVALLGLVHLGVAHALGVLRRTGRLDDRGVHNRATAHHQPIVLQQQVHALENLLGDVVRLQQVPEVQDRRLVRHTTARQLGKLAHRVAVVQRLFHRRIAQAEPLLHEVNAQHRLDRVRLATHIARLRVVLGNLPSQVVPRHCLVHLAQKLLAPRPLALARKLRFRKTQLAHHVSRRCADTSFTAERVNCSDLP